MARTIGVVYPADKTKNERPKKDVKKPDTTKESAKSNDVSDIR